MLSNEARDVRAGSLTFTISADGKARFSIGEKRSSERGRFWRMSLSLNDNRDVPINSEDQECTIVDTAHGVEISYASLRTASGTVIPAELTVRVLAHDGELEFRATGRVQDDVSFREISLPVLELEPDPSSSQEVLYRAEGLGRRIVHPRKALARAHSEYMRDDAAGIWEQAAYPGEMSMAWQGVELPEGFLYIAKHDTEFRGALFGAGIPTRQSVGELWLTVTTASDRKTLDTGAVVLAVFSGGWRSGARRYRSWAGSTWYAAPANQPEPKIKGWQRIIMKHQFGGVQFRYDELVDIYEQGRKRGLDGILLFGWWKSGFDRGYPVYEPDEDLGGASALRAAIQEIYARGGFVSLYANGNIIDRTTEYFSRYGAEVSKKDDRGLDLVAGYDFAGESLTMRYFAAPSFVPACHGSQRWRSKIAEVARAQSDLGCAHVFFDQTGFHLNAWPCFDSAHDHGAHTNQESLYRAETFREVRTAARGAAVGSEGMADNLIPLLDFHHGCGFAFQLEDEAYPALFRSVFPEPVVSNRFIHDERPGWEDQLNYAFTYNLAFDVAINRARRTIDDSPAYAERIERLVAERRTHAHTFDTGVFDLVDDGPVVHSRYSTSADQVDVFWNRGPRPIVLSDARVLPANEVALLHRSY